MRLYVPSVTGRSLTRSSKYNMYVFTRHTHAGKPSLYVYVYFDVVL